MMARLAVVELETSKLGVVFLENAEEALETKLHKMIAHKTRRFFKMMIFGG